MAATANVFHDQREAPRNPVDFRVLAQRDGQPALWLQIVNVSAQGLMARVPGEHAVGERFRLTLPVVGAVIAEVRWALGGRIGCELERAIGVADYYELLAVMARGR